MTIGLGALGAAPRAHAGARAAVDAVKLTQGDPGGHGGSLGQPAERRVGTWVRDLSAVLDRSRAGNPSSRIGPERAGCRHYQGLEVDDDYSVADPGEVGVGEVLLCRVTDDDHVDLVVPSASDLPEQDGFGERP